MDMKRASGHRSQDSQGILKQGYLLKKSEVLKKWNLRYFVLSKECLCYYRSERESRADAPKELIFFNDMSLYIEELTDRQTKYCLKIVKTSLSPKTASRTYSLSCFSEEERNEWMSEILYAKAITLVADPTAWINGRQETSADHKGLDFEVPNLARADRHTRSALQRCKDKLSLSRGKLIPHSTRRFSVYDLRNANSILSLNSHWRNSSMYLTGETIVP